MDGISNRDVRSLKKTIMLSMKNILAAASLAVLSAAGIGTAVADPQDHDGGRERGWERHERFEHRATVDHMRVAQTLRFHRYWMIGDPYFVHGRYVVRTHDRFGRVVFVQVDPFSGAFIGEVRL
jgi:hypothetical protein